MTQNETRVLVRDYLNNETKEKELLHKLDLKRCSVCNNVELEEDLTYHTWDLGQAEDMMCPDCKENE